MKLAVKILLALSALALSACGTQPGVGEAQAGEAALTQQQFAQDMGTLAVYDCSVSIKCADGSSRSCNGTGGACSASAGGTGSVTCNGGVSSCTLTVCSCRADGCCNSSCTLDPDCGGGTCQQGAPCSSSTQCGTNGTCRAGRCMCLLEP